MSVSFQKVQLYCDNFNSERKFIRFENYSWYIREKRLVDVQSTMELLRMFSVSLKSQNILVLALL